MVDLHHAGQKLGDLHAVFADPGAHLEDIASSMRTLCKMFERLRISLQQTNKPFEGYDGFDRTLRNCELFVQSFRPAKPGKPWTCTTEDVSKLEAQIMMQIALLSTTNIVLLAYVPRWNSREVPGFPSGLNMLKRWFWLLERPSTAVNRARLTR